MPPRTNNVAFLAHALSFQRKTLIPIRTSERGKEIQLNWLVADKHKWAPPKPKNRKEALKTARRKVQASALGSNAISENLPIYSQPNK